MCFFNNTFSQTVCFLDPRFSHLMVDFVHSSNNDGYLPSPAETVSERKDQLVIRVQSLGVEFFLDLSALGNFQLKINFSIR
jgi:hypothetical protein